MRQLTKTEIEKAPDWATHFNVQGGYILFESKEHYQLYDTDNDIYYRKTPQDGEPLEDRSKPIPR